MWACLYLLSVKLTEEREGNEYESESNEDCAQDFNENVKKITECKIEYINANKDKSKWTFLLPIFVDSPISLYPTCIWDNTAAHFILFVNFEHFKGL